MSGFFLVIRFRLNTLGRTKFFESDVVPFSVIHHSREHSEDSLFQQW